MAMIGTTAPLLLLAAQVVHPPVVQAAAHHLAAQVVALGVPQEALHAEVPPRVHLAALVAADPVALLAVVLAVVRRVVAQVEVHPVVDLVEALLVVAPKVAHLAEVRKAVLPSERVHPVDHKRIQMPSPASKIPIISSNLRAFSSSLVSKGVPEIIRATSTYQPPSMHIAIKATKARSPQVKSG